MSNQLQRQLAILKVLPGPGRAKSTGEIHEILKADFSISKRTVERDLVSLADAFPQAIHRREDEGLNGRTSYWHLTSLRGLLPETLLNNDDIALALTLLRQQAYNRLPRSISRRLDSLWEQAAATSKQNRNAQQWMQLIQYLPDPIRPESPPIEKTVQSAVEDALRHSDKLDLTIRTLDGEATLEGLLPLRLLLQEEILYLMAEYPAAETMDDSIRLIPLHRIINARSRPAMDGTSLEPDLAQQFVLGMEGSLRLVIRVNRPLAEALFNRPIGRNQRVSAAQDDPDQFIVTTDIDDTPQLRRWLKRRVDKGLEIMEPRDDDLLVVGQ